MSGRALHLVSDSLQAVSEAGLDISEQELVEALREAQVRADEGEGGAGALSARELSVALSWPHGRILESLRSLKELGQLEVVIVRRQNLIGHWQGIPCYRLRDGAIGGGA